MDGYFSRDTNFITESLLNILLLLPVGAAMRLYSKRLSWKSALLTGLVLSGGIELMQFFTKRGLSELSDVLHNTLGCVLGYFLAEAAQWMIRCLRRL